MKVYIVMSVISQEDCVNYHGECAAPTGEIKGIYLKKESAMKKQEELGEEIDAADLDEDPIAYSTEEWDVCDWMPSEVSEECDLMYGYHDCSYMIPCICKKRYEQRGRQYIEALTGDCTSIISAPAEMFMKLEK